MKRTLAFIALIVGACTTASAQVPGVSITVTAADSPDGRAVRLLNGGNLPIDAFLVTVEPLHKGLRITRIYYDMYVNHKHDVPIPSGTSTELPVLRQIGGPIPTSTVRAVIFSDGTTSGEQLWVDELVARRAQLVGHLRTVLGLLATMSDKSLTKDEAMALVKESREARRSADASDTPEERQLEDTVFLDLTLGLDPPARFTGKAPAFQRTVAALSRSFEGWLADVEAAPTPHASVASAN